jgi:hypothetical protein
LIHWFEAWSLDRKAPCSGRESRRTWQFALHGGHPMLYLHRQGFHLTHARVRCKSWWKTAAHVVRNRDDPLLTPGRARYGACSYRAFCFRLARRTTSHIASDSTRPPPVPSLY